MILTARQVHDAQTTGVSPTELTGLCDSHEALRAQIVRLEREREDLIRQRGASVLVPSAELDAMRADAARLRETLWTHGQHRQTCAAFNAGLHLQPSGLALCTCGLAAALKGDA